MSTLCLFAHFHPFFSYEVIIRFYQATQPLCPPSMYLPYLTLKFCSHSFSLLLASLFVSCSPPSFPSSPRALLFSAHTYSPAHHFYFPLSYPSPLLCSTGHPILNHKPVTKATAQHDRKQQLHTHTTSEFTLLCGCSFFIYVTKKICAALTCSWDGNRYVVYGENTDMFSDHSSCKAVCHQMKILKSQVL